MKNSWIGFVILACLAVGCSGETGEKATEQEKANIDRFVREGIKEGDMGGVQPGQQAPAQAPKGAPGNQPVDAP